MKLSRSSKLDFMIVNFATALLKVSMTDEEDENLLKRADNKEYSINQKIDRRITNIKDMLDEVVKDMYDLGGQDLVSWTRSNLQKRVGGTLAKIEEDTVNLEYLALFILYTNFAKNERNGKSLSEPMYKIQERMSYILDTTAMFNQVEVGKLEGAMYEQSYKIIAMIKA